MNQHRFFQTARRGALQIVAMLFVAMLSVTAALSNAVAADRIFAADSCCGGTSRMVYEITDGSPVQFALLNAGGYIGPLAGTADGRLLVVTHAFSGSLWDISAGGDFTSATPLAQNLFPTGLGFLEGLALDADGNAYISNSEAGVQNIAVVAPDGSISFLPDQFNNPTGLAVLNQVLYISEGGAGQVLARDLATGSGTVWATGFTPGGSHISGQLAVDPSGRLLLLWSANMGFGVFDITNGGDFTGQTPLVAAPFSIDVNQLAVDSANSVYAAGNGSGAVWVSHFDGTEFGPFQTFVTGVGDTESVAVVQMP